MRTLSPTKFVVIDLNFVRFEKKHGSCERNMYMGHELIKSRTVKNDLANAYLNNCLYRKYSDIFINDVNFAPILYYGYKISVTDTK